MKIKVAILLALAFGQLGVTAIDEVPQHYCGRRLSNVLAMLCENGLMMMKRAVNAFLPRQPTAIYEMPWIPEQQAKSFLNTRRKRQIVDECCFKPCVLDELTAYCAP